MVPVLEPAEPESPTPARARRRDLVLAGLVFTAVVIVLPIVGPLIRSIHDDQPMPMWPVKAAAALALVFAIGWSALGVVCLHRYLGRPAAAPRGSHASYLVADPKLIRDLLAQHDLVCSRCGYSLHGLTAANCPECHAPVDVSVSTAETRRAETWVFILLVTLYALHAALEGVFVLLRLAAWSYGGGTYGGGLPVPLLVSLFVEPAVLILGLVPIIFYVVRWRRSSDPRTRLVARSRAGLTSVLILLAVWAWALIRNVLGLW